MPRRASPHPYYKTITRYVADGRQVTKSTPGAVKHTVKTATYYADIPGLGTVALKTEDEAVAWKRLAELLREQHRRELGVTDDYSAHAKTPVLDHLAAWLRVLAAKGTGIKQRQSIESRLTRLFGEAKWQRIGQISADGAMLALSRLQRGEEGRKGLSMQTRNHYVTHLKGFVGWLVLSERLSRNPVAQITKGNVGTDLRHKRRTPSRDEIRALFAWLDGECAPQRMGMTGARRAMGYRVAMATGFRANELRSLRKASFDLDAQVVRLEAAHEKRRREVAQPLPPWLCEELRAWFASGGECWERFPPVFPGRLLRDDLRDARAAWIEAAADADERASRSGSTFLAYRIQRDMPLFWDFHSLRVYYISELAAQPGIDIKTLMTLARHSTPQLTLGVYAKTRDENLKAAAQKLGPP